MVKIQKSNIAAYPQGILLSLQNDTAGRYILQGISTYLTRSFSHPKQFLKTLAVLFERLFVLTFPPYSGYTHQLAKIVFLNETRQGPPFLTKI